MKKKKGEWEKLGIRVFWGRKKKGWEEEDGREGGILVNKK